MINLNNATNLEIESKTNGSFQRSLSGKIRGTNKTYQYFSFSCDFNNKKINDIFPLLESGQEVTIQLPSNMNQTTDKSVTSGDMGFNTVSVNTSNLTLGSFVKFSNHNKLYTISAIVDGSNLRVYPELLADVDGAAMQSSNIQLNVIRNDDLGFSVSLGGVGKINSMVFEESL